MTPDIAIINTAIAGVTGLVVALGGWYAAKKRHSEKETEVFPQEMAIIVKTWREELSRQTDQKRLLEEEIALLKDKIVAYERRISSLESEVMRLQNGR